MSKITNHDIKQKRIEILKEVPEAGKSEREDINPHKLPLTWNVPAFFHHVLFHKLENPQAVDIDISNAGATALAILSNTALGRKYLNSGWGFFSELISTFDSNDVNQIFSTISERIKNELTENEAPFWKKWEKKPGKKDKKKIENDIGPNDSGPGVIWSCDEEELYTKCCLAQQRLFEIDKYLQSNNEPLRKKYVYDLIEDVFGRETLSAMVVWNAYNGLKTAQEGNSGFMAIWNASTGSSMTNANRAEEAAYYMFHLIQGLYNLQISSITDHGIDNTAILSMINAMRKKSAQQLRRDREPIFTVIRWIHECEEETGNRITAQRLWDALLGEIDFEGLDIEDYIVYQCEDNNQRDFIKICKRANETDLKVINRRITFKSFQRYYGEYKKLS